MPESRSPVITIGGVAREMGVTPGAVRKWEAAGLIPEALRLEPGDRRVWPIADLIVIRERVTAKRAGGRRDGPDRAA